MQLTKQNVGVRKSYGTITVDNVSPSLNEKKHQAQLRQVVTSIYPGVRPGTSLSDGLFPAEAFGAEAQEYSEERVTWVPVPVGTTKEQVEAQLKSLPNARLVRILSLKPILSEEQKNAMQIGLSKSQANGAPLTEDDYREKQAVRYGDGHPQAGQKIPYNNHEQYRVITFMDGKAGAVEDIDLREDDLNDLVPVQMGESTAKKEEVRF